jgi:hypothetical protein
MYAVNYLSVKITQVSNIQNVKDSSVSSKELSTKTEDYTLVFKDMSLRTYLIYSTKKVKDHFEKMNLINNNK